MRNPIMSIVLGKMKALLALYKHLLHTVEHQINWTNKSVEIFITFKSYVYRGVHQMNQFLWGKRCRKSREVTL